MARVVLLTGGNVGDTKELLRTAQRLVNGRIGAVLRCSHCYTSAPWGFEAAQPFVNQVLVADTDLTPHEVLAELQRIERELGRNRAAEAVERPPRDSVTSRGRSTSTSCSTTTRCSRRPS